MMLPTNFSKIRLIHHAIGHTMSLKTAAIATLLCVQALPVRAESWIRVSQTRDAIYYVDANSVRFGNSTAQYNSLVRRNYRAPDGAAMVLETHVMNCSTKRLTVLSAVGFDSDEQVIFRASKPIENQSVGSSTSVGYHLWKFVCN